MNTINLPSRMKNLDLDPRGFPIFFTIHRDRRGVPDFTVTAVEKLVACGREGLCGICGGSLRNERQTAWLPMCFIGGSYSFLSGMYADPAMHRECADYATKVCPYMLLSSYRRKPASPTSFHHEKATMERSKYLVMVSTRGFHYYCNDYLYKSVRPEILRIWQPGNPAPVDRNEFDRHIEEVRQANVRKVTA